MSARRIKLTWHISRYYAHSTDGIRVRIETSDANLMPAKVFAYQMMPIGPAEAERAAMFDHVCSPSDLEEYPEDEPIATMRPAWFRLNYVDVLLRSRTEVDSFIRDVTADVQSLKEVLDVADELIPEGELWIGEPPTP